MKVITNKNEIPGNMTLYEIIKHGGYALAGDALNELTIEQNNEFENEIERCKEIMASARDILTESIIKIG